MQTLLKEERQCPARSCFRAKTCSSGMHPPCSYSFKVWSLHVYTGVELGGGRGARGFFPPTDGIVQLTSNKNLLLIKVENYNVLTGAGQPGNIIWGLCGGVLHI